MNGRKNKKSVRPQKSSEALEQLGGEPLEGSGFEDDVADADFTEDAYPV
jgi:hypothetical protein